MRIVYTRERQYYKLTPVLEVQEAIEGEKRTMCVSVCAFENGQSRPESLRRARKEV